MAKRKDKFDETKPIEISKTREQIIHTAKIELHDQSFVYLELQGHLTYTRSPADGDFELMSCKVVAAGRKPLVATPEELTAEGTEEAAE